MEKYIISRVALGQVAALGDLYDVRNDSFCGLSIIKKKIPEEVLDLTDNHCTDISLFYSDSFSEKFSKLDVTPELQASVLSGLVAVEGFGTFLLDQKISARTIKTSLFCKIKTKEESVNFHHEKLKDSFVIDANKSGMATHVVVGISWGANFVVSCEYHNTENKNVKEIQRKLSAKLKKMFFPITGNGSGDLGDDSKSIDCDVRVFGDALFQGHNLPTTFEGALNFIKQMPSLLTTSNQAKGKPLVYRLIPLWLLNFASPSILIHFLEEEIYVRIVQFFENISRIQQDINDFYEDAFHNKICVLPEDLAKIANVKHNYAIEKTQFRSRLAHTILEVRSKKLEASKLDDLIREYKSREFSPDKVSVQFAKWQNIALKISFANSVQKCGAKYIGFGKSDDEILHDCVTKAFVLYFQQKAKDENIDAWRKNRQLFYKEMKKGRSKYFVVDCDIHPDLWPRIGISIQVIQNGECIIENLLDYQEKTRKIPSDNTSVLEMENFV